MATGQELVNADKNLETLDGVVTSEANTTTDRNGREIKTLSGIESDADSAIANTGWFAASGSFEDGGTINERNQVLILQTAAGSDAAGYYSWGGALPKSVSAGSTPDSAGGQAADAWTYRADAKLRTDIAASGGAGLVGYGGNQPLSETLSERSIVDPVASTECDVFVVYGQSNAAGGGSNDISGAFECPDGWALAYDWDTGNLVNLSDPFGKLSEVPSAWPAFAKKWALLTGRKAVMLNAAVGGSTIFQLSSSSGSARWTDMISATGETIDEAIASGLSINSVSMIWAQGETDAKNLTDLTNYQNSQAQIESEFRDYLQTNYSSLSYRGMWLSVLGFDWSDTDIEKHQHTISIQMIQTQAIRGVPQIRPVWDGAPYYTVRNNLMQADGIHYTQTGYNLMGEEIAQNIYLDLEIGLSNKSKIIEKALRLDWLRSVAPSQLVGTSTDFPSVSKIMDIEIKKTLMKHYADRSEFLYGDLINDAGFGLKFNGERIEIENQDGTVKLMFVPGGVIVDTDTGAGLERALTLTTDGRFKLQKLQDGSSGLASGDLYYDSTDSNRVKYVP